MIDLQRISIHAPRTGSDKRRSCLPILSTNFNPRSPHGERHTYRQDTLEKMQDFNPRSPHGERRDITGERLVSEEFQSTLPARGATEIDDIMKRGEEISIHAPRTGSDR